MDFCSKNMQFLVFSFCISISSLFPSIGGGIVPYAYYKNEAYILVSCDSFNKNKLWGDFGIDSIKNGENFYTQISHCAHFGTLGMFTEVSDLLFSKDPDLRELAFWEGIEFFNGKIQNDGCKHFVTKHKMNKGVLEYDLFFVEVPFMQAHFFMENLAYFRVNYGSMMGAKNYFRRNGFAWINVSELIYLLCSINKTWLEKRHQIFYRLSEKNSDFIAKAPSLIYNDCDLIFNEYFAEELRSKNGILTLQKLLHESSNWVSAVTH